MISTWTRPTGAATGGWIRPTWGTRLPIQNEWPNSRPLIDEIYENVPADEKAKTWAGNAVKYFKLDAAKGGPWTVDQRALALAGR